MNNPERGTIWQHLKRGTIYGVVCQSNLQINGDLDNISLVTYQNLEDPEEFWTRPLVEFVDGRFKQLTIPEAITETGRRVLSNIMGKLVDHGITMQIGDEPVELREPKNPDLHISDAGRTLAHRDRIVSSFGGRTLIDPVRKIAAFETKAARFEFNQFVRRVESASTMNVNSPEIEPPPPENGKHWNHLQIHYGAMVYLRWTATEAGKLADCVCPSVLTKRHTLADGEALEQGNAVLDMHRLWDLDMKERGL